MEKLIKKWNYGNYSSSNYGSHTQAIQVGRLSLFFSYDTVVAFRSSGHMMVVCENVWSSTTGKHLNWLEQDKKARVSSEKFDVELKAVLKQHDLIEAM